MPRFLTVLVLLLLLAAAPGGTAAVPVPPGDTDVNVDVEGQEVAPSVRSSGRPSLMIELGDAPSSVAYAAAKGSGAPDAAAAQEARVQRARVERAQQAVLGALPGAVPGAGVLYRVQTAYNGIAVRADAGAVARLRALPGVKAVHVIPLMERTNASSVPLIGAPAGWQSFGRTGTGIKIGIIDSGIDYVHTNFGGSGTAADYDSARNPANNTLANDGPLFPTAKVVGGFDFAGDAYDPRTPGADVPAPDRNPLDCDGHGSHVAGTAAGFGVNADGSTYTGAYNTSLDFGALRIGPGVAPQALLFALRVFGCDGSTALTTQAIDWAVDPNDDGDPSDRLDVINMSLGSAFGTADDPSSVASNNASAAGVLVANSAGNSGDVYYVSGSPGSASRAVTVASSVDSTDIVDGFDVSLPICGGSTICPATRSAAFDWSSPLPANKQLYYPATNQYGCSDWSAAEKANINGKIVLVDWRKPGDATFPCGSVARANNATAAGAAGIIMADNTPYFATSISGNATTPAMYTNSTTGDALKSGLDPTTRVSTYTVTFNPARFNSTRLVQPELVDTISDFTSRGPRAGDSGLKPDISAPGQTIFSTANGTGNQGASLNGTSMAAPHVAGALALLRQQNPAWTVEEIKALAMNTAAHDLFQGTNRSGPKYGPARVGAGRVDVPAALGDSVVAYVDDGTGAVGVSFGAVEVVGSRQLDKTVRVSNKGGSAATYTLGYDPRTTIPGVSYSFPDGNSITVPAGGSTTFRVRLSADAAQMRNTRDATVAANQAGNPRQWLSEASGLIILSGSNQLRVPVYATARPASNMTTAQGRLVFPSPTGAATLNLTGQGVDTGSNYPTDITSVVTALELAAVSPPEALPPGVPESARQADLQYVGVTAARRDASNPSRVNNSTIYFGIVTHRTWSMPATNVEFDIYLDLNRDGTDDYVIFTTRLTEGGANTDVFVTTLLNLGTGVVSAQGFTNVFSANRPTALFNTNVLVMPVNVTGTSSGLAFSSGTRFDYTVATFDRSTGEPIEVSDTLTYDYANPGLDFQANAAGVPMYTDRPGDIIPVTLNQAAFNANGSQGALLLHHYNAAANRAQVVPVRLAQTITLTAPATKTYGDPPFTVGATSSAGLPVTITSLTPSICTIDGANTVTIVGVGACTLRASAADNGTYAAATADATITIAKADQTITFDPLPNRTQGEPPFTVNATASSGLPVTFTAGPASVCAISGNTVTLTGPGSCTVTASQGGNANYNAAPSVARTFQVVAGTAPSYVVTVTTSGPGSVAPGSGTYSGLASFTATPADGAVFLGWTVDGTVVGFGNPLALLVNKERAVQATFAARPAFSDVPTTHPAYEAITQLAARGVARGFGDGTFHPNEGLLRAQMAGFLVRLAGWGGETPANPFRDRCAANGQGCIDAGLWNEVAVLAFHDVARGYPDNVYLPRAAVVHAQVISFITRTMVAKGWWDLAAEDDPAIYPNVPAASGHRLDLVTFVKYAGPVPGRPANRPWGDWDQPASRGWTAGVLWQAYSSYFGTNRVP